MNASDGYDGSATAFEGETTLLVRSVPAGARIRRAVLTATPVAGPSGTLFEERIDLSASSNGAALGATKVVVKSTATTAAFVEVDFHKRRTLAAVTGSNLSGANLQVDLGGVYVEVNDKGAIVTPTDSTKFAISGGTLPGLTVGKFKLTSPSAGGGDLDVATVTFRTTPANLTVRLGKMPPFWARTGELAAADSSPDFAALLQTFLATATVENGFYLVPLVVHSDTLARLAFTLDLDYLDTAVPIPNGLSEIALPYGPGTVDNAPAGLSVSLPPNARVVAGATTARVAGQFAATRIVDGHGAPTGPATVAGTALATPTTSLAQIIDVAQAFSASAVDVSLTGLTRTAQLGLDLRADLDGKPDGTSLLGGPVQFTLQSTPNPTPAWVTVPLASAFHFANAGPARYWIVLQSLEGQVTWNTAPAAVTTASLPPLQQTTDGGLSWRATALSTGAATQNAPFTTLYRFRYLPDTYQIPIELQVGSGDAMTRVKLDRFAPLSRVDFTLDVPEVADGFNTYLGKATPSTCSQAEHLANGDFRQWQRLGTNLGAVNAVGTISPTGPLMFTADGQYLYVGASTNSGAEIDAVEVLRDLDVHRSTTLGGTSPALFGALSPDGTRAYLGTATALHVVDMTGRSELGTVPGLTVATTAFAAISPDGATLYLAGTSGVQAYTTASLDDALRTQTPATATSSTTAAAAAGIALSPDGTRLYIADDGAGNGAKLTELDAVSLHAISTLALGKTLAGIAVTPDGKRVVVVDAATPTLFVVDAVAMDVVGTVALGANNPRAVALAPDGTQAYVVADDALGGHWLTVIDPSRLSIIGAPVAFGGATGSDVGGAITTLTLAAAPSGTRLYLADASAGTLASMSIGTLVPADWTPSGTVQLSPVATASPVVLLGDLPSKTSGSVPNDASISQVVPVAGGCGYIFSFQAVAAGVVQPHTTTTTAAKPDATAEVFWLDGQCGLAKTDTIPIAGVRGRGLTAYRTALTAPTGAVQAEVRFRATAGTLAEVGTASLAGSTDTVTNGDLQQIGSDGVPTGWTVSPSGARVAVSASPAAAVNASSTSTVRVRNPGTQAVELTQTVDLSNNPASVQLACDARTSATSASASTTPALAIDFAGSDGTALGTTTSIALAPGDFDQHPAELAVPAQAAHATVRLQLPPSAAVDVRTLTLSPVNRVNVPVAFVAQSPGELRVSNAVVAYERVPLPPPPVPANGLCTPTPANRTPGDGCAAEGGCWCTCCNAKRMMQRTTATTTPAGRPAMVGTCTTCGTTMLAVGGTVAGRPTVTAIPTLLVPSSPKGTVVGIMSPRQVPQLTDVPGIGATRASALTAAGITSVDALARAKPEMIANTLRGVTAANAEVIVKNAQRLSATANQ